MMGRNDFIGSLSVSGGHQQLDPFSKEAES